MSMLKPLEKCKNEIEHQADLRRICEILRVYQTRIKIGIDTVSRLWYKNRARYFQCLYFNSAPLKCQSIFKFFGGTNMSTTMLTKETVERKWYVLDAAGKPLGKTAAIAADLLRGKLKTTYTPHVDCGDYVIIINAKDAVLTGKKLEQKYYRTHSGWVGGLKETQYKHLMANRPELAMRLAVRGMLQKNTIAQWQLKRLRVFAGAEHTHAAQKPEVWDR
jgi:large subunit ribosomal protein L13